MNRLLMLGGALIVGGSAQAQGIEALGAPGSAGTIAWGINDAGQIVGQSAAALGGATHATRWDPGFGSVDLGVVDGALHSTAYAINESGQAVGYSEFATGVRTATLWNPSSRGVFGGVVDLGADMGASGSVAWDINDLGVVAGQGAIGPGFAKGFVWDEVNGGRIAGGSVNYQGGANRGINNSGVLVGSGFFFGDPDNAFLSRPDGLGGYLDSDIAPAGYNLSIATDISETDICVGFTMAGVDVGWQAAIFLGRGEVTLLGTLADLETSEANAVNDAGMVVGYAWDSEGFTLPNSAWAWVDGTMYDLNDFIAGSGFTHLFEATDVNNHGDIVGYGVLANGSTAGFVMRGFVPAPGALGVLAMGLGVASRRRR